jgi:hypothetical protein
MTDDDPHEASKRYLDELFGAGAGEKHTRFLAHLESEALQNTLHSYHVLESDTRHLSVEENYLIGMCVLLAVRSYGPAAMFAKTLRHLGVPREKIVEAVTRTSMWIGGVPAAEGAAVIQRALREWEEKGFASLSAWFPDEKR